MQYPATEGLGPEDGTDNAHGVDSDAADVLETPKTILAGAGAGTAADGQQGLGYLETAPEPATEFDTEATRPRSRIRVVAVMGALFVSCDSFALPIGPCQEIQ